MSRAFLTGVGGWSRGFRVCGGGDRCQLRKRVCGTQRCWHNVHVVYDDLNRRELESYMYMCNGFDGTSDSLPTTSIL